jgi:hypothetical protein
MKTQDAYVALDAYYQLGILAAVALIGYGSLLAWLVGWAVTKSNWPMAAVCLLGLWLLCSAAWSYIRKGMQAKKEMA